MLNNLHKARPQLFNILSVDGDNLKTVTSKSLGNIVPLQVLGWMTGDGHIVVVDDELHVQVLRDGKAGRLCVVPFLFSRIYPHENVRATSARKTIVNAHLLGAIRPKKEHGLVAIGQGNAVHERPDVAKATGRELHTGSKAELRVAGKLRVGLAIVKEVLPREISLERRDEILSCDAVT